MSYKIHLPVIHIISAAMILLLSGCASKSTIERDAVFYPVLPNPPYIQHLKSITALKDIGVGGGFSDFVLGRERDERLVVKPYGITVHKGKIYVVDTRGGGYVVLDLSKKIRTVVNGGREEIGRAHV